jgi:hypothetical protein
MILSVIHHRQNPLDPSKATAQYVQIEFISHNKKFNNDYEKCDMQHYYYAFWEREE